LARGSERTGWTKTRPPRRLRALGDWNGAEP